MDGGPHKGLKYLERMANDLPEGWKVVVIGLSDKQLETIPTNILGIKRTTDSQELAAWYTIADVFVNPTLEDTYSMTNLEAQACATPVVTFDSDGAAESVLQGKGAVVRRLDYTQLMNKVMEEANHKESYDVVEVKDKKKFGKRLFRNI